MYTDRSSAETGRLQSATSGQPSGLNVTAPMTGLNVLAHAVRRPSAVTSSPKRPPQPQRRFDGLRPTYTTTGFPAKPAGAIWFTSTDLRSSPSKVHENCLVPLRKVTLSP
jgi:hypothetical protein